MTQIKSIVERAKFFQSVQVWPLSKNFNYAGWLSNFKTENDKKIACLILDFFIYFSADTVDSMFIFSIQKAGSKLSQVFPDWKHSDFLWRCIYQCRLVSNNHNRL